MHDIRDGGDCWTLFSGAGNDAVKPCDRIACSVIDQDYNLRGQCQAGCFSASCDWSKSMCAVERAHVASCQLYDSVAWSSFQSKSGLRFVAGGSARLETYTDLVTDLIS